VGSPVTGKGFGALSPLPYLEHLSLDRSAVDDRGLDSIAKLRQLRSLRLYSTRVTRGRIDALRQKAPQCRVLADHGDFAPMESGDK
ncbi:MAG TPA: hypothetical protein VFB80_09825, partial [Pirellulaceae bacterium]|nr:hypothetical protein [Pirellulaceae bacterium]